MSKDYNSRRSTVARVRRYEDALRISYPDGTRAEIRDDDPVCAELLKLLERIRSERATSNWRPETASLEYLESVGAELSDEYVPLHEAIKARKYPED